MSDAMELTLVALRLVQFASAMVLLGAPVFALALARREFTTALGRPLLGAAAAALVSALLWLDLEAAIMGGDWAQALDPGTLGAVLVSTEFGSLWQWHLGLGAAILAALLPRSMRLMPVVACLGAALVANLAGAGHALMQPKGPHLAVMALHLLAGGLWLGSLPALFHALRLARRSDGLAAALMALLPRYSRAGYFVVALLLLTGIVNSAFLVGSPGALAATAYGRVLIVKIALVLVMVAIAAVNRFRLVPAIARGGAPLGALVRSVALEQGVAVLVLAAVSLLGILPPALGP